MRTQSRDPTRETGGESQTTPRPSLGSQQCLCWVCESLWCLSTRAPASCCQPAPHPHSNSSTSFLEGLACNHVSPGWRFKPNPHQSVSNLISLTQARGDSRSFQMMKKHSGDKRVSSMAHGEAICPTGPTSRTSDTRGLPETKPTQCKRQSGGILNGPGTL